MRFGKATQRRKLQFSFADKNSEKKNIIKAGKWRSFKWKYKAVKKQVHIKGGSISEEEYLIWITRQKKMKNY